MLSGDQPGAKLEVPAKRVSGFMSPFVSTKADAVSCVPGQKISFKVRDRDGRGYWSDVVELGCGVTE
jgi:hypothetical protein